MKTKTENSNTLTSHSFAYLLTIFRHSELYALMPILATSSGPLIPRVLSISYSCVIKSSDHVSSETTGKGERENFVHNSRRNIGVV